MDESDSLTFDRAVAYYDRTRGLTEATMARLIPELAARLGPLGRCLEIGVGTGRMALPLHDAGVAMVGLDLSAPMLERLTAKREGERPLGVVLGDATDLPFADDSFGSALAVHVLHLIPRWREAVAELVRVVGPGGRLAVDVGRPESGRFRDLARRFADEAGLSGRHRGINDPEELDDVMRGAGAEVVRLDPLVETRKTTTEATIGSFENGIFSFTWAASEEVRRGAAGATRAWAKKRWGDLDTPYDYELRITFRVYDLPG